MVEQSISIGVDIAGSNVSCVAVDLARGEVIEASRTRVDIDCFADANSIFTAWARALNTVMDRAGSAPLAGIGFAMPGPFDYREGISRMEHKFPRLYGRDIAGELRRRVRLEADTRIRFLNDATAFVVGEAWLGKGGSCSKVLGVTFGTGLGSAFVDQGVPVVHRDDVPEEGCLWRLPFRYGVADQFFTTRWFVKAYADRSGGTVKGARDIAEMADAGDRVALAIFERFSENLVEFLTPWLERFSPDMLVLGGNIARAYRYFGPALETGLGERGVDTVIEISHEKERSAMLGAARLSEDAFWEKVGPQQPSI